MVRYDQLSFVEKQVFHEIGRGVLSLDCLHGMLPHEDFEIVPLALKKLKNLSLAEKNKSGSWRLTPAGLLIWRLTRTEWAAAA